MFAIRDKLEVCGQPWRYYFLFGFFGLFDD